ncbi:hypothetical protein QNH48_27100 [Neobacillus sp. YX16]|uniref:hypothetical protein n=1 Tax=Neobacillus sp. YX16 TaxID=3047874 RepID=UPI0024C3B882|nr:hypothetical protein [Neobacillus sp. YX16]WHZ02566.1 hypothetical protein QNH48_27100 [Neobacillus sp. YX16]
MLAEIQGKISRTGSNLTERLEDNLTGNVFGVLRYIPFSAALGEVLANGVYPKSVGEEIRDIHNGFWADCIDFWPYDREGEIDALIEFENVMIGIEVKYTSGLSSDDEVTNHLEKQKAEEIYKSINQLARESRIVSRKGQDKNKLLLFIADRKSCKDVYVDISARGIIEKDVAFGYISWQDILLQLKNLQVADPFHQVMIQDIIALLTRKGFEDFTHMHIEAPQPINEHDYFKFSMQNKVKLSFETTLSISEGLYYEFGG